MNAFDEDEDDAKDQNATVDEDDVGLEADFFGALDTSSKVRRTLDFYKAFGCVVPTKPDNNPKYIDLGPAAAFAKEYEDEKAKRKTCSKCKELGHGAAVCVNPPKDTRTCRNCNEVGHTASDCPKPRIDNRTCNNCKQTGHIARDCPDQRQENRQCRSCERYGHIARDCPAPREEKRQCKRCGKFSHTEKDCPSILAKISAHCEEGTAAAVLVKAIA